MITIADCHAIVRGHKELCERRTPGRCPPLAAAGWGDRLQLAAVPPFVDRDMGLRGARILRRATDPEFLLFAADVYGARVPSPEHRFRPGELQRKAEAGGLDSGDVHQAMAAYLVDAAGRIEPAILPYDSAGGIRWMPGPETVSRGGFLPETLAQVMVMPDPTRPILDAAAEAAGLAGERRRHHQVRAATRLLRELGFAVVDLR